MTYHPRGLLWAERSTSPWPKVRSPRGTKALGLQYERTCARAFPSAEHGAWFRFQDTIRQGYCSPDLLLIQGNTALVVECKLTNWLEAWDQLHQLYIPVVGLALGVMVLPVVLVKHVSPGVVITHSLREAIVRRMERPVLHWLGHGPFPL